MLSRWLQRSGVGQMLAPDSNVKEEEESAERNEFAGGVWSLVAPDPNFQSPEPLVNAPTSKSEDRAQAASDDPYQQKNVLVPNYQTPQKNNPSEPTFLSPSSSQIVVSQKVERLVLSAAKDLTFSMLSPPKVWEDTKTFLSYCACSTKLDEKKLKKVKRMLKKDPTLCKARASNMGNLVQNGFTPLHAAASVGNFSVAEILIEFEVEEKSDNDFKLVKKEEDGSFNNKDEKVTPKMIHPVDLNTRDVQGRTALHVASEHGQLEIVQLLKSKMTQRQGVEPLGEHAPTDLTGRTPLGWAATSRETKARRNRGELRKELFSPGDKSVFGQKTPAFMRTGTYKFVSRQLRPMDLIYGFADMPGHRIEMEDAICHACPILPDQSDPSKNVAFFGVFDGHGDGGLSSEFVAENIVPYLTASDGWKKYKSGNGAEEDISSLSEGLTSACSNADTDLKIKLSEGNSIRLGGSTGVMACITSTSILIGNVGDSRCILVQQQGEERGLRVNNDTELSETVVKGIETLSVENGTKEKVSDDSVTLKTKKNADTVVTALSTDHTPDLQGEKKRIENSGLSVIEESFEIDGETITLSKIHKSTSDRIAVSRAFGDFDYKANDELKKDEQAIICSPEITVHSRDHDRDMYLILACDGIFDVMSNDEVGDFVVKQATTFGENSNHSDSGAILPKVGDELMKKCLELGSTDNMSVLIVALPKCTNNDDTTTKKTLNFADV